MQLYHGRRLADAHVALDTGATSTLITPVLVRQLGLGPSTGRYAVASATGVEMASRYRLGCVQLGDEKVENLEVTAVALPGQLQLDGLLGLNFLSHFVVTFDYASMEVRLERVQATG